MSQKKRFDVAFSFPDEFRDRVDSIASLLAQRLPKERILYDKYHQDEFARLNLDIHLQGLYRDQSELIIVLLCEVYNRKQWCGVEWRAMRGLIPQTSSETIMLLRADDGPVDGIIEGVDSALDIRKYTDTEVAELIFKRLTKVSRVPSSLLASPPASPDTLMPVVTETPFGLAIHIENTGVNPIKGAKVVLLRTDEFLPNSCEFTRNEIQPICVLVPHMIEAGASSFGNQFAQCDTSFNTLKVIGTNCKDFPRRELEIRKGTWRLQFGVMVQNTLTSTRESFAQWTPGSKPRLTTDPCGSSPPTTPWKPPNGLSLEETAQAVIRHLHSIGTRCYRRTDMRSVTGINRDNNRLIASLNKAALNTFISVWPLTIVRGQEFGGEVSREVHSTGVRYLRQAEIFEFLVLAVTAACSS